MFLCFVFDFLKLQIESRINKEKSKEILPPLLLTLTPPSICMHDYNAESQKKVNKSSTMKEDESALLIYLLISL